MAQRRNLNTGEYRPTIWISDVHLGTRDCKSEELLRFLTHYRCDTLYLVGDIIDGWQMRNAIFWNQSYHELVHHLLRLTRSGTRVVYVSGNHDEFLRRFGNQRFDNISLTNSATHITADGRRILVIHGDQFDYVARCHFLLKFIGDKSYSLLIFLSRIYNALRRKAGLDFWSLSSFIKNRIPRAAQYIRDYEEGVAGACRKSGFDGVVCGHIHHPNTRQIGGVDYYNTGDWVEHCSAIVEHADGRMELVMWTEEERRRVGRTMQTAQQHAA